MKLHGNFLSGEDANGFLLAKKILLPPSTLTSVVWKLAYSFSCSWWPIEIFALQIVLEIVLPSVVLSLMKPINLHNVQGKTVFTFWKLYFDNLTKGPRGKYIELLGLRWKWGGEKQAMLTWGSFSCVSHGLGSPVEVVWAHVCYTKHWDSGKGTKVWKMGVGRKG